MSRLLRKRKKLKGKELTQAVIDLQDETADLQDQINTIELTPGPQGDTGATGADGGNDDADGVEITFAREFGATGTGRALDLNGTNQFTGTTPPDVTLNGQSLTFRSMSLIPGTNMQQVIFDLPPSLLAGTLQGQTK